MKTPFRALFAAAAVLLSGATPLLADYASTVNGFGPLGYWRFNETAASPALNIVANSGSLGSAADGNVVMDVTKGLTGIVGNAISLNNPGAAVGIVPGRVDVPYSAGLNPAVFSVEFWAKPSSLGPDTTGSCILTSLNGNGLSGGNRSGWVIYLGNTGVWRFWVGLTAGYAGQLASSGGTAAVGNWYHVVCTYDGSTQRIYVNGNAVGSLATSAEATGWKPQDQALLRMGGTALTGTLGPAATRPSVSATSNSGNRGYNGFLDETAIYATALTPEQVKAHYDAATTNTAGYAAQILADAPVAYWKMDESSVSAPDPSTLPIATNSGSVGNAADGTNMWGTLAAQNGAPYAGFGVDNKAVFFDGANGSVGLPDATGLHFSGNITLMAWVKPTQKDYFRNILAHGLDDARGETFLRISRSDDGNGGGTTTNYYEVGVANGVASGFNLIYPGGTANYYHAARFPIPAGDIGNWVFVAGTYDGTNWRLYRNGQPVATYASVNGAYDVTNRWSIGSRTDPSPINAAVDSRFFPASGLRFGGMIDEPAIFNTALSDADINSIYNAAMVPPTITRAVSIPSNVFKGSSGSFSIWAEGSPTLGYLWYSNGISTGVTTTNLTLNNIQDGNLTVEVVVTNPYGSTTSSVTFLVAASKPLITQQPAPVALYEGRPFSFSVSASGTTPISYQWQTNGIDIPGANSPTYTGVASFANAFNYSCVLSNEAGISNSASLALTVIAAPTGYGSGVFTDGPVAYWRLGDTSGSTAYDYFGGLHGTYFAAQLNQAGFSDLEPDKAVAFNGVNSYAGNINGNPATGGINFQGHVNFSLEAWVNGPAGMVEESTIIAKGAGNSGTSATEQFSLDVAAAPTGEMAYRFFTRGGGDSLFEVFADVGPNGSWDHVVGVYDDTDALGGGSRMYIFVNGEQRGSAGTRPSGLRASSVPVSIGSKRLGNNPNYDGTFNGVIDEVAIYNYALTANQISNHYASAYGTSTKPNITRQPTSLTVYESSPTPPSFEVGAFGTQPVTYQWKKQGVGDLVDGGNIIGANTRKLTIDPVSLSDAGNYFVTVNNTVGPPTNSSVASLTVIPAPTNVVNVPGLVLHLTFDGTLNDSSGRGNHGTGRRAASVIGVSTNTTAATPADANPDFNYVPDGVLGKGLHYKTATENGGNSAVTNAHYVTLGDKADLRFGSSVNFSVAYWVRFPAFNGIGDLGDLPFISSAINSYGNAGYTFAPSYNLGSWSYSLNGNVQLYGGDYAIDDGMWHHLAHTFDRTGSAISYLDGKQVDVRPAAAAGNLDSGNPVNIGQDPTGFYPEEGYYDIDDVGFWRRALTAREVVGIYLAATLANSSFVDITPSIAAGPGPNQVTITYAAGVLQSATNPAGPFVDVPGASSPYTISASGEKYYRTHLTAQ